MEKKKVSILSIVLYILSGILALYSIWSLVNVHKNLQNIMEQQQITFKGYEYDIINSYVSSVGQYVIFAVILLAFGLLFQKLAPAAPVSVIAVSEPDEEVDFSEEETVTDEAEEMSIEESVNEFDGSSK